MQATSKFSPNLKQMLAEGFKVSIGQRSTSGPIRPVKGHREASEFVSNRPALARYSEIEFLSPKGGPSTFVGTACLLEKRQLFIGYHQTGFPLLLGETALGGHGTILGPTQVGKSGTIGSMAYQTTSLDYSTMIVGFKRTDPLLLGSCKAGCGRKTRFDQHGELTSAPFDYFTLEPGVRTKAFNYHSQPKNPFSQKWLESSFILQALGFDGSTNDANRRYFFGHALRLFTAIEWGACFRQQYGNALKVKQDRESKYATAGVLNELAQLAAIDQVNRPAEDSKAINIERTLRNRGGIYFDCCFQDVGPVATAVGAVIVMAIIAAKRVVCPSRSEKVFVFIDEAQHFPRTLLKALIEQAASAGVILVLAYHTLDQMGEDVETISMTQTRMIFGAVPGGSTDRHLQHLFGTHPIYRRNFTDSAARGTSQGITYGPIGTSVSEGSSQSQQFGFGFTETEEQVWTPNDTLKLNYNRDQFVLQVSPGAELAHFGPSAILGHRAGLHLSFDEINRITAEALVNTPDTYLPGESPMKLIEVQDSPELEEKRSVWLSILNQAAEKIRREMS